VWSEKRPALYGERRVATKLERKKRRFKCGAMDVEVVSDGASREGVATLLLQDGGKKDFSSEEGKNQPFSGVERARREGRLYSMP